MKSFSTLLIVDDDGIIREGLEKSVPWGDHGIELVATARNGKEGLSLARQKRPDIVLSDIRMPFLNGLEMAESISAELPATKFVFLTAYTEFEYARKALGMRAVDYVVKSGDNREIIAAVGRAVAEVERGRAERARSDLSVALFADRFLGAAAAGRLSPDELRDGASLAAFAAPGPLYRAAVARVEPDAGDKLGIRLRDFVSKWNSEKPGPRLLLERVGELCAILSLSAADGTDSIIGALRGLGSALRERVGAEVFFGVGSAADSFEGLRVSYAEGYSAIREDELVSFYSSEKCAVLGDMDDFIRSNYHRCGLSLEDAASRFRISTTYLCALYKKHRGTTFMTELSAVRVERAKELLSRTELKIYEIAEKVGYVNAQYFATLFRSSVGETPSEYRRRCCRRDKGDSGVLDA